MLNFHIMILGIESIFQLYLFSRLCFRCQIHIRKDFSALRVNKKLPDTQPLISCFYVSQICQMRISILLHENDQRCFLVLFKIEKLRILCIPAHCLGKLIFIQTGNRIHRSHIHIISRRQIRYPLFVRHHRDAMAVNRNPLIHLVHPVADHPIGLCRKPFLKDSFRLLQGCAFTESQRNRRLLCLSNIGDRQLFFDRNNMAGCRSLIAAFPVGEFLNFFCQILNNAAWLPALRFFSIYLAAGA